MGVTHYMAGSQTKDNKVIGLNFLMRGKMGEIYDTETWEYTLGDDSICKVMPLADHPARGFAWECYHLFIKEFLK